MSRRRAERELEERLAELDDSPEGTPRRRREDVLEELVEVLRALNVAGSRNFRSYRRRATVAFAVLMAATAVEGAVIVHNADVARSQLARAGVLVSLKQCGADNQLRASMRTFIAVVSGPKLKDAAATAFPPRQCIAESAPLRHKISP